jgi:vacuolar-type H+-ATPase subunit E/Vma4
MAVNIRIGTFFDGKGLGIAKRELATLSSSVNSLKGNLVVAGAVIAGAFTLIGKSLADAAESQKVLAQTEAVLKSTGTTANGTAKEIAAMASSLQKSTSFNDEAILSGANLLLTFKNITNQAGEGNDIFDQTTQAMLDVARAMGTDASTEAIRLGKALNDPTAGISALTRVGIQFTDQQKAQIEALSQSGDLMGAQKIILAELQSQFGGSAAAYAATFAGQVEGLNNDLNDLSEEIGMILMPAVTGMIDQFRDLIPVIGEQLKAAIAQVDWAALVKSVVDLTTFLIENGDEIVKYLGILWALSTAVKTVTVLYDLWKVSTVIFTAVQAAFTTGTTLATVATTLLNVALMALPWVAAAAGIALIVTGIMTLGDEAMKGKPYVDNYGGAIRKSGEDSAWAASQYGVATTAAENYNAAVSRMPTLPKIQGISVGAGRGLVLPSRSFTPPIGGAMTGTQRAAQAVAEAAQQAAEAAAAAAAEAARIAEEARRKEEERLRKRREAYESFADSVKSIFGRIKESILSSFNLPTLGNSVNSITRNIAKLLERTKGFANSITQLSGLGLNSALLQQVIQAGPMAGSQLASAIVGGGSAFVNQLNAAYGEFGNLASGIAGVGTQSAFRNQEVINNYYQIEVSGGVGSGPSIGKAIVDAIKSYERTSGAVWQGA